MRLLILIILTFFNSAHLLAQQTIEEKIEKFNERTNELWGKLAEGNYLVAIKIGEENLNLAEKYFGKQDSFYANTLYGLGLVHNSAGHYQEAEDYFKKAIKLQKKIYGTENIWYISSIVTLANIYTSMGRYAEAEKNYLSTLPTLKKNFGEDFPTYNSTLFSLAALYYYMGKYEESIPYYDEVIKNWARVFGKESSYYATGIGSLASSYQKMDRLEEAEFLTHEAKRVHEKTLGKKHPYYATTIASLAVLFRKQKKFVEAENLLIESMGLAKESAGTESETYLQSIQNLSTLYVETKDYTKAKPLLLEVLKTREKTQGKNTIKYTDALLNLSNLSDKQGNFEEAEKYLNEVLSILLKTTGEKTTDYLTALIRLGYLYQQTDRLSEAEKILLEAIELGKKLHPLDHSKNIMATNAIAIVYRKQGNLEKAIEASFNALAYNCKTEIADLKFDKSLPSKIKTLEGKFFTEILTSLRVLIQTAENKANLHLAFEINDAAIYQIEKMQRSFALQENKTSMLAGSFDFISTGIRLSEKLAKINKDDKYIKEALILSEKNKSQILETALKGKRARTFGELPLQIALEEENLQREKNKLEKLRLEALSEEEKTKISYDLNKLNSSIDSFVQKLKKDYPQYYSLKYEKTKGNIIPDNIKKSTLILEYLVTEKIIYIFALSNEGIKLYSRDITGTTLSEQVNSLRKSLTDYNYIKNSEKEAYNLYTVSAYWFYKELIKPVIDEHPNKKELIIIADAELGHLPFETFLTQELTTKTPYHKLPYLINKYSVSYNYSLALHNENSKQKVRGNGNMLAIAASYSSHKDSLNSSIIRAPHHMTLRQELSDLPAAREEVNALSKSFRGSFLLGNDAIEKTFKETASKYSIIHLAMHGILNQRAPILSSLAFSENKDSTEDNFLEAWEISQLKLNAQLVVLSACETGYGKFQQGEGVISLARSFMYAGTPSLIVSMWQVNDASTAKIMELFYKNLANGMNKAEALRQAKLAYIKNAEASSRDFMAHPAFWAAFIQIGDSSPIKIAQNGSSFYLWITITVVFIILLLFILFFRKKFKAQSI
jgi:CHAT domain-containing protein